MTTDDEEKLRRAFGKLREHDARRAPRFEELARKGPPRAARSPWIIAMPIASAAAAAAVFLLWCNMQAASTPQPTAAAPAASAAPADQPVEDGKQAALDRPSTPPPLRVADPEPLGFLLSLPGSTVLTTSLPGSAR